MCNGASSRASQGGAIAVLHPSTPGVESFRAELLLRQSQGAPSTQAMMRSRVESINMTDEYHVVIHRDGNLLSGQRPSPLFQFSIKPQADQSSVVELDRRLELSVGGEGVIGRRVTVYRDSAMNGVLADGIIGWN